MTCIYIVEDDAALRSELVRLLKLQGFECEAPVGFSHAAADILAAAPDCVVLDLKLPGADGHAICRSVRAESAVPIIMLTSSDSEFDEVMGMNLGADDYVTKPYSPSVLIARIHALLRRANAPVPSLRISHKGVVLDVAKAEVSHDGASIQLTRNELKILHLLMANHDAIISRHELMCELWQTDEFVDDNTLTVNINRLRKSLASIGVTDFLVTRRGQGYLV